MTRIPTPAQVRLLRAVDACSAPESPADEWGEVFSYFDPRGDRDDNPARYLVMRNFDLTAKACEQRGWIRADEDGRVSLTDTGRARLRAARQA